MSAVNFLPFHGRQPGPVKRRGERREDRPPGAEVSLKDKLSLTHTLALFLTNTQFLSFRSLFLSFSHTSFPSPRTQFLLSLSFSGALFLLHALRQAIFPCGGWGGVRGVAACPEVRRRLHIPGSLAVGIRGSWHRSPKSQPSFPLISKRTM